MARYKIYDFLNGLKLSISQGYGENVDYYKKLTQDVTTGKSTLNNGHEGVDFPTLTGTKLYVPFERAVIVRAGTGIVGWKNYGTLIVLFDPVQRIALWFCHLQDFEGQVGDELKRGDVFAVTNNTGNTSGPHVHVNFCETDEAGNRINQGNGSLGFLNLMDTNLVEILPMPQQQNPIPEAPPLQASRTVSISLAIPAGDNVEDYMGIKKTDFQGLRVKCDKYDVMDTAGFPDLDAIDNLKREMVQQKEDMRQAYEKTIAEKDSAILELSKDNKELTQQKADILHNWQEDVKKDTPTLDKGIEAMGQVHELEQTIRNIANATNAAKPTENAIFSKLDTILRSLEIFKKKANQAQQEIDTNAELKPLKEAEQTGLQSFLKILRLAIIVLSVSMTLIGVFGLANGTIILAAGR